MVASFEDPEVAKLIRSIKHVRVNIVELDRSNRADATAKIADVKAHLKSAGWEPTIQVCEKGNKEAVFVNVVGNIKADQIAALCESLDIDALDDIDLRHSKRAVRKS